MAVTIACTQAERDALASAIKSGATRVTQGDRTIQYATVAEMMETLDAMDRHLGIQPASAANSTARHARASFSRD